jgi:hypothetical protein
MARIYQQIELKQKNEEIRQDVERFERDEDILRKEKIAKENRQSMEIARQAREGDGSPDDLTCKKFGFKPQTANYADCRLKIEIANRQALQQQAHYEEQKRRYDEQQAAIKKEKDHQRNLKQLELGLRMMAGQSVQDASMATAGMQPLPKPPGPINQTIIMPGGKMVNCSTTGTVTHCF